ncbi:MAG: sigma-70 family RNA polymerase sigma factor [Gemmatales bacterium]
MIDNSSKNDKFRMSLQSFFQSSLPQLTSIAKKIAYSYKISIDDPSELVNEAYLRLSHVHNTSNYQEAIRSGQMMGVAFVTMKRIALDKLRQNRRNDQRFRAFPKNLSSKLEPLESQYESILADVKSRLTSKQSEVLDLLFEKTPVHEIARIVGKGVRSVQITIKEIRDHLIIASREHHEFDNE